MPFQQGTVAVYPVNRQLYPLTASGLIPSHRLQVNLSILVGFMDPDTGVTEEVADSPVTLLCAGQAGNSCHIPHLFQDVTSPRDDLTAHIIFTEDSFRKPYSLLSRTYRISSDNKAFWPNMGGYSIFAYCLDVTSDQGVRLDWYMAEEGNADGWKVEDCYILEQMRDVAAIPSLTSTEWQQSQAPESQNFLALK